MEKLRRVCVAILLFTIFQINVTSAKQNDFKKSDYADVCANGQVSIDTQVNGASQDYKQVIVYASDIFKTNKCGNLTDNQEYIKYVNIMSGEKTPTITQATDIVAVPTQEDSNVVASQNSNLQSLDSYNPPKTAVENNIVLLIVSFIISSTITIGLGKKIKRNRDK